MSSREWQDRWVISSGIPKYTSCYECPDANGENNWSYVWVPTIGFSLPWSHTFDNEFDAWHFSMSEAIQKCNLATKEYDTILKAYKERLDNVAGDNNS